MQNDNIDCSVLLHLTVTAAAATVTITTVFMMSSLHGTSSSKPNQPRQMRRSFSTIWKGSPWCCWNYDGVTL